MDHKFQLTTILGIDCVFTIDRVKREEYPELNKYELMHDDSGSVCSIQTAVLADFYGTILSKEKIIGNGSNDKDYHAINGEYVMDIEEGTDIDITNNFITIEEYMEGNYGARQS